MSRAQSCRSQGGTDVLVGNTCSPPSSSAESAWARLWSPGVRWAWRGGEGWCEAQKPWEDQQKEKKGPRLTRMMICKSLKKCSTDTEMPFLFCSRGKSYGTATNIGAPQGAGPGQAAKIRGQDPGGSSGGHSVGSKEETPKTMPIDQWDGLPQAAGHPLAGPTGQTGEPATS